MPSPWTQVLAAAAGSVLRRHARKKEIAMSRIVLAGLVVGLCASLALPSFAQITNEACVLRCLDHGNLDQTCEARCTKGVPSPPPPALNRAAQPRNVPAVESTRQSPAAAPSAPQPTTTESTPPQPAGQSRAVVNQPPPQAPAAQATPQQSVPPPAPVSPQPMATQATPQQSVPAPASPQPMAVQATPQQSVKPPAPPARPVNEACVLRCLDHGHLDEYCERVCTR